MTIAQTYETSVDKCRRVVIPACEPSTIPAGTPPPVVINSAPILVRKGDTIDVGLDWSDWLAANGGELSAVAWAAHTDSPQAPTISGATTLFNKGEAMVLLNLGSATSGHVYWLTCTATIAGIPVGGFTLPNRTVARTIAVRVV